MGQVLLNAETNSGNPSVALNAGWTLEQRDTMLAARSRTFIDTHNFIWSRTKEFQIPTMLISSSDMSTINDWWRTVKVLDFTLNSSEATTVKVQLMHSQLPVAQFDPPYRDKFRATLLLRAIDNSDFGANP